MVEPHRQAQGAQSSLLEHLCSSRTSVRILTILVTHPSDRFYFRELCRLTGMSSRPVQLALRHLTERGIVQHEQVGPLKYFRVNQQISYYGELRQLLVKTERLEPATQSAIQEARR